jgi:hypothetical protein
MAAESSLERIEAALSKHAPTIDSGKRRRIVSGIAPARLRRSPQDAARTVGRVKERGDT